MIKEFLQKAKRYLNILLLNVYTGEKEEIINNFHKLYYDSSLLDKTWGSSKFLGYRIEKCPFDIFTYQEIIYSLKPDLIIETGTSRGGSALFMATIMDAIGHGRIITIDKEKIGEPPEHQRIKYIIRSSVDPKVLHEIREEIKETSPKIVMVILDSDHKKKHVLEELHLYHQFVTVGSYLIVEDTNINGHPVNVAHGPGPMEALEEFKKNNSDFIPDKTMERHLMSFNPNGYLKRNK